ncbi:helix-turn-helix domain-containing protein [Paenibacillus kobensis]|uniref:helix-turn-helix domain-containing protein n=1 Tax=Paenibacillus kobensis TaxID=59841 RepID=UPI000FD8842C|nr:helix-turn-helix domain-containing protein [Paenibacillus kobensis]
MRTQVTDYPLLLKAAHVAEILGVAKSTAYEMMRKTDFPVIVIDSISRVPRDKFFEWLDSKTKGASA